MNYDPLRAGGLQSTGKGCGGGTTALMMSALLSHACAGGRARAATGSARLSGAGLPSQYRGKGQCLLPILGVQIGQLLNKICTLKPFTLRHSRKGKCAPSYVLGKAPTWWKCLCLHTTASLWAVAPLPLRRRAAAPSIHPYPYVRPSVRRNGVNGLNCYGQP